MFASKDALFAKSSGGYQISRSLRFRSSASAYLSRTPASATERQQYTISFWFKRGLLNTLMNICSTNGNGFAVQFSSSTATAADTLRVWEYASAAYVYHYVTNAVYRDPSGWYHCVIAVDGTTTTYTNSVKIYINGLQVTSFSTQVNPTSTFSSDWNNNVAQNIGRNLAATNNYLDGYIAEFYSVPGQLLPTAFGAFDTNGVWQPAKYTGSYGTNGFYLPFSDNSALTTASNAGIGKDFSGNSNYWVTNNINISAYSGTPSNNTSYDSIVDTPTNYSDGLNGVGNYPVANPSAKNTNITISNGNLTATSDATTNWRSGGVTFGNITSGKWYYEATATTISSTAYVSVGWQSTSADQTSQGNGVGAAASNAFGVLMNTSLRQTKANASIVGSDANTNASGDIIMVAVDFDNSKAWIGKNGTWYDSGNPSTGLNPIATVLSGGLSPAYQVYNAAVLNLNFGQRPFTYTPPSGFSALNTQNLPTPTIAAGNKYFDATVYTGTAATQNIVNSGSFQPDLVWTKRRSVSNSHQIFDAIRGVTNSLQSDTTNGDTTTQGALTSFNNNGFTVPNNAYVNSSPDTFIGWQWKAGGTGVSNTSGSITSTVSSNTSAGFSVVTYTQQSSGTATVGHGLGVAPSMIIVKGRNWAGSWYTYHSSVGIGSYLLVNTTAAATTDTGGSIFNGTAPTSTVFSLGSGWASGASQTSVAYCFAPVAGYSAFGSYTGNGSADGAFVYLGFRPRFLLIKSTTLAGAYWQISDTSRDTYNVASQRLWPNASSAEDTFVSLDILSNGFKARSSANTDINGAQTYIYAAFAENPFKNSRAR